MEDNLHSLSRRLIELRIEHADLDNLIDRAMLDPGDDELEKLKREMGLNNRLEDKSAKPE